MNIMLVYYIILYQYIDIRTSACVCVCGLHLSVCLFNLQSSWKCPKDDKGYE